MNIHTDLAVLEPHHKQLAEEFSAWARATIAPLDAELRASPTELHRRCLGELARAGWLKRWFDGYATTGRVDLRAVCLMREILAYHGDLADFAFSIQGLGVLPIALFGTAAQQEQYVRPMERGEKVAAFAVSELGAGTELSAITTTAIPTGDGYRIDGAKAWISHATIADFFVVLARSSEAEGALGLSLFAVDRQSSGVEVKETPLLSPRPFGQVEFRACHVPAQNLIGVGGRGLYAAMSCLELARPTVGAAALGFAKRALEEAVRYCTKRKVSGKRLSDYQMTKQKLAEMSTAWHASRLLVYQAAWSADTGRAQPFKVGAMAKWFATEHAQSICDDALQLCGASGLVANSTLESLYRSVRSLRIYEGTTEILKLAVADDLLRRRPEARDHA